VEDEYNFKQTFKDERVHLEVHQYQSLAILFLSAMLEWIFLSLHQRTPLDVALNKGHNKVAEILRGGKNVSMRDYKSFTCKYGMRDTCKYGMRDTCKYGMRDTCKYGMRDICKYGMRDICKYGMKDICKYGMREFVSMVWETI